jgi:DNA-directed RNA polymerase I, II, and III subunit RPABC2
MFVSRGEVVTSQEKPRITEAYYSKYEYTTLLSLRAQQLADGAPPFISIQEFNRDDPRLVWKIAEREILEKKLPFIVRRKLPDGTAEYWSTAELELIECNCKFME